MSKTLQWYKLSDSKIASQTKGEFQMLMGREMGKPEWFGIPHWKLGMSYSDNGNEFPSSNQVSPSIKH